MRLFWNLFLVGWCVWSIGCGGTTSAPEIVDPANTQTVSSSAELKKLLQDVAASGTGGSGLSGIKESIDQAVRPGNAKLADDLTNDFNLLSQTSDPEEIKTIATRMADRL